MNHKETNLDDIMPRVLRRAAIHAKKISQRGNQKCDRLERVNHFVTDLRRMLCWAEGQGEISVQMKKNLQDALCNKTLWYDILELEPHAKISRHWVAQSQAMCMTLDDQVATIEGDIEDLREDLTAFTGLTEHVVRINERGDDLGNRIEHLFTD